MYAESNKAVCRRFIQKIFNDGDLSLIRDFVSPDAVSGVEGMADLYRHTFADFRLEVKDQIAEGDRVVTFLRLQGAIDVSGIRVDRFANGKIAESWFQLDALGERLLRGDRMVDCVHCDAQVWEPAPFGSSDSPFTVKRAHGHACGAA